MTVSTNNDLKSYLSNKLTNLGYSLKNKNVSRIIFFVDVIYQDCRLTPDEIPDKLQNDPNIDKETLKELKPILQKGLREFRLLQNGLQEFRQKLHHPRPERKISPDTLKTFTQSSWQPPPQQKYESILYRGTTYYYPVNSRG